MELAARRFARWVLAIHVLLFLGVATLIVFAAREVYSGARRQAIEQASKRQTLLAEQTARGIQSYYDSIIDNFELLRRTEDDESRPASLPAPTLAPLLDTGAVRIRTVRARLASAMWQQLENRASHFFIVDRITLSPAVEFPVPAPIGARQIIDKSANWLRKVQEPSISGLLNIGGENANLVCVPITAQSHRLFVAAVPLRNIEQQFLQRVNADQHMSALLMDEQTRVMAGFDPAIIGLNVTRESSDPRLKEIGQRYIQEGKAGTEIIPSGFVVGGHRFNGGLVSIQPVELRGGKRWWLSIGSTMDEIDSVVRTTFRHALWWAIFVVSSMTAILVSTAIQMIRSRVRLDRIRHEMLTRELSHARQIQLAWLPRNENDPPHIDLTAVNKPASHVSGDFYNWFDLSDGRICVVIGDVTGHGMAAAFLMATTQLLVRMTMPRVHGPGECLEEVNRQLCGQVFAGQFVTMQILVLDRANGRVEIATAGHPPPLIGDAGVFKPLELEPQLVLGIERDVEYPTQSFDLPDGASFVLYTDGVIEAQAPDGRFFNIEGLCNCIQGRFANAQDIADRVLQAVDQFRADRELLDDLTLLTVQLEPAQVLTSTVVNR